MYCIENGKPAEVVRSRQVWRPYPTNSSPQGTIMIARRNVLLALWIGIAFVPVEVPAAEPSATSFVEGIYAPYKDRNGKGNPLDTDAAVKRYFEPKLAALIIKDRNNPSSMPRIGTSVRSTSPSAMPATTRRTRPFHSRTWTSRPPWSLTSSSSGRVGGSPTSTGAASQLCADFSPSDRRPGDGNILRRALTR